MKSSRDSTTLDAQSHDIHASKIRIIKNLLVLSISWWMLFSAYDGLLMFQSTLNSDKGMGVISVSVQYAFGCLTAVLFPKYFIRKLGCKKVIVVCIASHAPFIAANFYPRWILMIPSSILLGAANPLLWAALCAYLNNISSLYTTLIQKTSDQTSSSSDKIEEDKCVTDNICFEHEFSTRQNESGSNPVTTKTLQTNIVNLDKNVLQEDAIVQKQDTSKILEATTARFFGYHGMIYQTCHVTSNILSYYIFRIGIVGDVYVKNSTCDCGSDFCNDQVACFDSNLKPPSDTIRYILTSICLVLVIISVAIVVLFLDELNRKREATSLSLEVLMATLKLMKRSSLIFLIPLSIYIGILQGFIMGDYTQAYVGCAWGIPNVGLVSAVFGFGLAISATLSGWFVKYVGRQPIFLFVAAINVTTGVILLLWRPDGENPTMMFVVGGFLGVILGSYWAQLRALYGIIFKEDEEAAFGNYQLWHSVGVCVSFGYSKYLCTSIKIYLVLFCFTLGILGYLLAERSHSKSKKCTK